MNFERVNGIGKVILGYCFVVGLGVFCYKHFRDSHISTLGLSVRHVVSDYAIWNLSVLSEANTIKDAMKKLQSDKESTKQFLKTMGFGENEITEEGDDIEDRFRYEHSSNDQRHRFVVKCSICVQSEDFEKIKQSAIKISKLMEDDIRIENDIKYLYKNMDDLRIDMIKEATQDSKNRAEKIAESLNLKIKGVKDVSTGKFSIVAEDSSATSDSDWREGEDSIKKKVKVVVRATYKAE